MIISLKGSTFVFSIFFCPILGRGVDTFVFLVSEWRTGSEEEIGRSSAVGIKEICSDPEPGEHRLFKVSIL
jgi:hypothetical protein